MTGRHAAKRRAPRARRRRWPTLVLLAMIVLGYALYSVREWQGIDDRARAWTEQSQAAFDEVANVIRRPSDERTGSLEDLRATVERIDAQARQMCTPRAVVRWQRSLGAGDASLEACADSVERVDHVARKLELVARYLEDEAAAARILDRMAGEDNEVDEDAWADTIKAWREVRDEIAELEVSAAFEPTRAELLDQLETIDRSWRRLVRAHEEKNIDGFATAQQRLRRAYRGLSEVSEASASRLAELDQDFIDAYAQAYSDARATDRGA